jgi:glycosyltransferase involved in cell wall biosynthesis
MNWCPTCAVVIPCCNEEASIGGLVRGVHQHLPEVIVVDDGSRDQTAALAAGAGAQVIRMKHNLGKGVALKAGMATASDQNRAWAVVMDGDGQHRPEDIPAFLRCAERTGAPLIVGNRMHSAQAIPWLRRVVNRWMSRHISERAGRFLPDSQCGFRLVNLKTWAALPLETDRFEIESEMLLAFAQAGYRVEFVPIRVIPKGRHSHIRPVRDTLRWFRWWNQAASGRASGSL